MTKALYEFRFDERLGVVRPWLHVDYEDLPPEKQHEFELRCQEVLARIPEKIKEWEQVYMNRFEALQKAEDEKAFFMINEELNDISSILCDLNLLYLHIEGTWLGANVTA
jgi:hypothetical protein